jgi:NADPH:quinone reductase-like Zn-dependent oxidoreductase
VIQTASTRWHSGRTPPMFKASIIRAFFLRSMIGVLRVVAGLIDAVANGQLKVLIDRVFPLAEAAQAHRYILERKAFGGRVLLRS